jgi:uncharacterized protein YigE (DUF2233 family)
MARNATFLFLALTLVPRVAAFISPAYLPISGQQRSKQRQSATEKMLRATVPAATDAVQIYPDADTVGATVRGIVERAAQMAISERGHFALVRY